MHWSLLNEHECGFAIKPNADSGWSGDLASMWLAAKTVRNVAEIWQVSYEILSLLVALTAKGRCQGSFSEFTVGLALARQVPIVKIWLPTSYWYKNAFFFLAFPRFLVVLGQLRKNSLPLLLPTEMSSVFNHLPWVQPWTDYYWIEKEHVSKHQARKCQKWCWIYFFSFRPGISMCYLKLN